MSQDEQARIIAENLRYYLEKYGYTQREVADAIGVSHQRFSSWCQGKAIPRMDKVQALADFFHVPKSYIIDVHSNAHKAAYYLNPEAAEIAQEIYETPELHMLFDAARDVPPEDLVVVAEMVKRMKRTNPDG